ncbi:hypothetical protein RHECNPAF_1360090 [Rhizobium etli CNPAF512]|nr:hypothetical protein RHECNPAF_1360090 [Rhizobium etli CNPAF512]
MSEVGDVMRPPKSEVIPGANLGFLAVFIHESIQ